MITESTMNERDIKRKPQRDRERHTQRKRSLFILTECQLINVEDIDGT